MPKLDFEDGWRNRRLPVPLDEQFEVVVDAGCPVDDHDGRTNFDSILADPHPAAGSVCQRAEPSS
jgi:hypothetical protein